MTYGVEIEVEIEKDRMLPFEELLKKVTEKVLDLEECPYEAEVNLLITDDEGIHGINLEMRDIDSATDVLSFPMYQYEIPGDFGELESEGADCFNPETGELMLGDIVVSIDHVYAQAEKYGHSAVREFAFLIAHSMLHLIGYDHMETAEEKVMFEKQEVALASLGITR